MIHNQGYDMEEEMMKVFNGKRHTLDCIDFQTETHFYDVKSCRLIINCKGGKKKKRVKTTQLGRFFIKRHNHISLKEISTKENKIAEYIFVLVVGNQKIWKTVDWEKIDSMITKSVEIIPIKIHEIFKKELRLR